MTIFELHGRNADLQFVRDPDGETKATRNDVELRPSSPNDRFPRWVCSYSYFISFGFEIDWPGFGEDWKECHIGFVADKQS
jgi:hypothetical protein